VEIKHSISTVPGNGVEEFAYPICEMDIQLKKFPGNGSWAPDSPTQRLGSPWEWLPKDNQKQQKE
jgi:hypothetical protein